MRLGLGLGVTAPQPLGGGGGPVGYTQFQPYFIPGASNQRGGDPDGLYEAGDADLTGRIAKFRFGNGTTSLPTITVTIASPAVVTYAAHGFSPGQTIIFRTSGALPTGLAIQTIYYVKEVLSASTFTVTATPDGAAIDTTGSQSGVHRLVFFGIEDADTPVLTLPGGSTGPDPYDAEPQTVGPAMSLCKTEMATLPANVRPLIILMSPGGRGIYGGGLTTGAGPWNPDGAGPAYQLGDSGDDTKVDGCLYLGVANVWAGVLASAAAMGMTVLPPKFVGCPLNENDTGAPMYILKDRAVRAINGIRTLVGYPNAPWVAYGANAEWVSSGVVTTAKVNAVRKMIEENLSYYAYMDGPPGYQSAEDIHYDNAGGRYIGPLLPAYLEIAESRSSPIPKPVDWLDGFSNNQHAYGVYRGVSAYADGVALRVGKAQTTVTVTIATPGVVTWTAHGKLANDPVTFTTTGALPTGLLACRAYYVKTVLDPNTFTVSATAGGTVIDTTGSQSGVHKAGSWVDIDTIDDGGIFDGEPDYEALETFGGGVDAFMVDARDAVSGTDTLLVEMNTATNFLPLVLQEGEIMFSGYRPTWGDFANEVMLASATATLTVGGWSWATGVFPTSVSGAFVSSIADSPCLMKGGDGNIQFRLNGSQRVSSYVPTEEPAWGSTGNSQVIHAAYVGSDFAMDGVVDTATSLMGAATCTITIASPAVITRATHGYATDATVRLTTTGALPTGLATATTYYVKVIDANTFTLALTAGGADINTSGSQSGVHSVNTFPAPGTYISTGLAWGGRRAVNNRYGQGRYSCLYSGSVALTGADKNKMLAYSKLMVAVDAVASQAAAEAIAAL